MKHQFYNRSLKVIISKTLLGSVFFILIISISTFHILGFIKENKGVNILSTAQLIPLVGLFGFLLTTHVIIWILTLKELINVWHIYIFDDNCMKISVLSMILKTIHYKDVTKIEINNSERNEICNIYYQTKHVTIDRNSLHYLDMKILLIQYCKNAELVENYE